MSDAVNNFSYLMDLLAVTPRALEEALGADLSLISRWRTGTRKLMPRRHWVRDIAAYFYSMDEAREKPILDELLRIYYPGQPLDTRQAAQALLENFLTAPEQNKPKHHLSRALRLTKLSAQVDSASSELLVGVEGVQTAALAFLDYVMSIPEPQHILYICPEGLEVYTRDESFSNLLIKTLMQLFQAGHRLTVVLRTDFRMSDVSTFSGPWLLAHLLDYVDSFYYDDFRKISAEGMIAVVQNQAAMRAWGSELNVVRNLSAQFYYDKKTINEFYTRAQAYLSRSIKRFHYRFFSQPDAFLQNITGLFEHTNYLFSLMPHFCICHGAQFIERFSLAEAEYITLQRDFQPLLQGPAQLRPDCAIRHLFCEEEIFEALEKSRHVCSELSLITGRRVLMTSQSLAAQLLHMKQLLAEHPNYELCFLKRDVFNRFIMQIGVWGDKAAIGWVHNGASTACKDFTSVGALQGFCATIWGRLPILAKSRLASERKLDLFLKKARQNGYL